MILSEDLIFVDKFRRCFKLESCNLSSSRQVTIFCLEICIVFFFSVESLMLRAALLWVLKGYRRSRSLASISDDHTDDAISVCQKFDVNLRIEEQHSSVFSSSVCRSIDIETKFWICCCDLNKVVCVDSAQTIIELIVDRDYYRDHDKQSLAFVIFDHIFLSSFRSRIFETIE